MKKKKYSNHHDVDTLEKASIDDESEPQQILNNNLLSSNPESVSSDSCSQAGIGITKVSIYFILHIHKVYFPPKKNHVKGFLENISLSPSF